MDYANLTAMQGEMDKCVRCAACQAGCPTYEASFSETLSARGRIKIASALLKGALVPSERIATDFDMCLSCMRCAQACPANIDTISVFQAARAEMRAIKGDNFIQDFIFKRILPYPSRLNVMAKAVGLASIVYDYAPDWLANLLPYSAEGKRRATPAFLQTNLRSRIAGMKNKPKPGPDGKRIKVAYFSGCMTDLTFPSTGVKVVEALEKAGAEVVYPEGQVCCGAPAWFAGDNDTARMLADRNMETFASLDVEAVAVSCATCGSVLKHILPRLAANKERAQAIAAKVVDFQKLIVSMGLERVIQKAGGQKLKVTYHDPCHLSRGLGERQAPRELLKSLPDVEYIEMDGADVCCGGSGAFALTNYETAVEFGKFKAEAVKNSGAAIVATSCPSCQLQLQDSLNRAGVDALAVHTADIIEYRPEAKS